LNLGKGIEWEKGRGEEEKENGTEEEESIV
jgi:hypothetical protein